MTQTEVQQYFDYHNSNIKLLKVGFEEIRNQIKNLYKKRNKIGTYIINLPDRDSSKIQLRKIEKSLYRILTGVQVSWAEESIKRLLYENNLFSDAQREYLLEKSALDQRWYCALHIVFCIAYDLVSSGDENCRTVNINNERNNLGDELVGQYFHLKGIITNSLVPNFQLRNKVQHGEWEYAFKPRYSKEYCPILTAKVNNENIITTTSRFTIVNALYQMIVDLGRFKSDHFALDSITTPFEYFYKDYIRKINFEVHKISNHDLNSFTNDIIQKEIKGRQYKLNNTRH